MTDSVTATMNGHSRAHLPADETREQKFTRLAIKRMTRLKATSRLVCNLAKYPHDDLQRDRIIAEVRKCTAEIERAFGNKNDAFKF